MVNKMMENRLDKKLSRLYLVLLLSLLIFLFIMPSSFAALSCDTGDTSTTCQITSPQTYDNAETFSGTGDLIISANVSNINQQESLTLNFPNITILSGGVITGGNITVIAENLTIDSGGEIDTDGLGYTYDAGPGAGTSGATYRYGSAGASHGGRGGTGGGLSSTAYSQGSSAPYGSSLNPVTYGSGGGSAGGSYYGGKGGGVIRLDISDSLIINGLIQSNGTSPTSGANDYAASGGAGGSIWITTDDFAGSGTIQAIGGNGKDQNYADGGGGGGGRIAIYYNESTFTGIENTNVTGGIEGKKSASWGPHAWYGGFGSAIFVDVDDNSATTFNGFRFQNASGPANESGVVTTFFDYSNPTVWNFTNLTIINTTILQTSDVFLNVVNFNMSNSLWKVYEVKDKFRGYYYESNIILNITAPNLTIGAGNVIDLSGGGYTNNSGPGAGTSGTTYRYGSAGASHGGRGGTGGGLSSTAYSQGSKVPYGSSLHPVTFGSGGGSAGVSYYGGFGGGVIRLDISDTLTIDGELNVNGTTPVIGEADYAPSGGAGGSIWITVPSFAGSGTLQAKGGNSGDQNYAEGGGGSGGRIAVWYNESTFTGITNSDVTGGAKGVAYSSYGPYTWEGGFGSAIFIDEDDNSATIFSGFRFQDALGVANESGIIAPFFDYTNPTVWNFTNLTILDSVVFQESNVSLIVDNFNLTSSLWKGYEIRNRTHFYYYQPNLILDILTPNLVIDNESTIDLSGSGYISDSGPGIGDADGNRRGTGGSSHGGIGGKGGGLTGGAYTKSGGSAYGNEVRPITWGSGGRSSNSGIYYGGAGGGVIKINISNTLDFNGIIKSDGIAPTLGHNDYAAAGGAGGSIWILAENILGNGTLQSLGGKGRDQNYAEGGGGSGGRIAVHYSNYSEIVYSNIINYGGGPRGLKYSSYGPYSEEGDTGSSIVLKTVNPLIEFVSPTPQNNSGVSQEFELNASIIEDDLRSLIYSWEDINYTLMDNGNTFVFMNFDNISAVGDQQGIVADLSGLGNDGIYGRSYNIIDEFTYNESWTETQGNGSVSSNLYFFNITDITNPYFDKDVEDFDESYDHLEIRYKSQKGLFGPVAIIMYYTDNTDCSSLVSTCSQTIPITSDGEWHTLDVEITDTEWIDDDGTIDDLRFLFSGSTDLVKMYIDYIKFYSENTTPSPTYVSGKYGNALSFDGVDDYIMIPDIESEFQQADKSTSLEFTPDATIMLWVKRNPGSPSHIINRYREDESDYLWRVDLSDDTLSAYFDNDASSYTSAFEISTSVSAGDNEWHHIAVTKDAAICNLYFDGVKKYTEYDCPGAIDTSQSQPILIGAKINSSGGYYFNGSLDELRIYNKTFTDQEINVSYMSGLNKVDSDNWTFYMNQTNVSIGNFYTYYLYANDLGLYDSFSEIRYLSGNSAPTYLDVNNTPSDNGSLDPGTTITIMTNVSDTDLNLDSALLQWKAFADSWDDATNITMTNTTQNNGSTSTTLFTGNFNLPVSEGIIQYRIWANDTQGSSSNSSVYNIDSFWDCTWNVTPTDLGAYFGWDERKSVGSVNILNTGDSQYAQQNCTLYFKFTHDLAKDRIFFDTSYRKDQNTWIIATGASATVTLESTFLTEKYQEEVVINVYDDDNISEYYTSQDINLTLVSTNGAYLYQEIETTSSNTSDSDKFLQLSDTAINIYLTPQTFSINSSLRNGVGDDTVANSAYNVSFLWAIPDIFTVSSSTLVSYDSSTATISTSTIELYYHNMSDGSNGEKHYSVIQFEIDEDNLSDMLNGTTTLNYTYNGYNSTGDPIEDANGYTILNTSLTLNFKCFSGSDGIIVEACGSADGDYVAPVIIITEEEDTPPAPGGGGSSGGSGSGTTEAGTVSLTQREKLFQTKEIYELVRGKEQNFTLTVENAFDGPFEHVNVDITGFLSQYLEIEPKGEFIIPVNGSKDFTIFITAPDYFTYGKYDLVLLIEGTVNKSKVFGERTVYRYAPVQETRTISLYIQEISKDEADTTISDAESLIEEMDAAGFNTLGVTELFSLLADLFENHDYSTLLSTYNSIKDLKETAFETYSMIDEVKESISNAHFKGITTEDTERLLLLAQSAFDRGDYVLALERANDAKVTLTLETLGRFNLINFIQRYWEILIVIAIILAFIAYFISLCLRYFLIKGRLKFLRKEKKIILGLIEQTQYDCFQENKIGMDEYKDIVIHYDYRMNTITKNMIELETKKSKLFKVFLTEYNRLMMEKDHIVTLMKEVQTAYLRDGTVEARSYYNKMDTYHKRLAEIEERLINMQAEKEMKKSGLSKFNFLAKMKPNLNIFKKKQAESVFFPTFKLEHKKENKIAKFIRKKTKKRK